MIDFSRVANGQMKVSDLASEVSWDELVQATNAQIDEMLGLVRDLSDAEVTFVATDPEADGGTGWNVGHLLAHVTASSEENAAVSSLLARGIEYPWEPRLRVEVDWPVLSSTAVCVERLEESRRIRLGYLNAWPFTPRLDTFRELPPPFEERVGRLNAVGTMLLGLLHEIGQFAQLRDIIAQAKAAS